MKNGLMILGQLSDLDVEWLLENGKKLHVAQDQHIISEDHFHEDIYIVLNGKFSIYSQKGQHREFSKAETGEILGEMSLVNSTPSSASVKATESSDVFSISKNLISVKLKSDPGFASRFYYALCIALSDRLRRANSKINGLSGEELEEMEDAIDMNVIENLHIAGARIENIIRKLSQN